MLLEIINKTHFCDMLLLIKKEPKSFNEMLKTLRAYPHTLNRRLKELRKYGLIEPIVVKIEGKERIKYRLTKKGREILPEIEEFVKLSKKVEERIKS